MTSADRGRGRGRRRPGGRARLLGRQLRADPGPPFLLALLVAVAAFLATAWQHEVTDLGARQLPYRLQSVSAPQRDVGALVPDTVSWGGPTDGTTGARTWAPVLSGMERVRDLQPEPLRSALGSPEVVADIAQPLTLPPPASGEVAVVDLRLRVDPGIEEHATLVAGSWPEADVVGDERGEDLLPVAMLAESAAVLGLEVGEVSGPVRLTGTYRVDDPTAPRWEHLIDSATLLLDEDPFAGTTARVVGLLSSGNPGTPVAGESLRQLRLWYPLEPDDVGPGELGALVAQLRGFTGTAQPVRSGSSPGQELAPLFGAPVVATLQDVAGEVDAARSVLAVAASGPAGVALLVLGVGGRLVVSRRASALALGRARGASGLQLRVAAAVSGLLLGAPAATLGWAAGRRLHPDQVVAGDWVAPGLLALAPALILAVAVGTGTLRQQRADLSARSFSRYRWILEVAVVALAVVAVWATLDRGLDPSGASGAAVGPVTGMGAPAAAADGEPGLDPLTVSVPVLAALATSLLLLRVYPIPLHALVRSWRRRRGLVGFLGAARAARDPVAGLTPMLSVVLGVSIAVCSAVLASTVVQGAQAAAGTQIGAHVRVSGPVVDDALRDRLEQVPGVGSTATLARVTARAQLTGAARADGVTVLVVDRTLEDVQAATPRVPALPAELFAGTADGVPVVVGGPLEPVTGPVEIDLVVGPVRSVGHVPALGGIRTTQPFLVVERSAWESAGGAPAEATVLLVAGDDTLGAEELATAVREAVPGSLVQTQEAELAVFAGAPVTQGTQLLLAVGVVASTALTAVAVLAVHLVGTPARVRLLAVLRTLGISRRQTQGLTAFEIAPAVGLAGVVGTGLGLAVPMVLLRALDLRGFTGGLAQPAVAVLPQVLAPVVLSVVAVAVVVVVGSAALTSRVDHAQALRVGEDR